MGNGQITINITATAAGGIIFTVGMGYRATREDGRKWTMPFHSVRNRIRNGIL